MEDSELLHPDTEVAIRRYLPGVDAEIEAALHRARAVLALWEVTELEPLAGGTRSVVVAGVAGGARVVVKVPLLGSATDEAQVLSVIPRAPEVLAVVPTALMLEHIDGKKVSQSDGVTVAEALEAVSWMRSADPKSFVPWRLYLCDRVEEFGGRIIQRSSNAAFVALARQVLADVDRLTQEQEVVPTHGDLQGKNLLSTELGVRVLDPLGILAPPAWETAFSVMSVIANGGDHAPVLAAAERIGISGVEKWLHVAAVAIAGSAAKSGNEEISVRVLAGLG
jgi:hypothetical protein